MDDDAAIKVGLLVLGWLFGLLSPAIVETIRRARDLRPMQVSVAEELHEFRFTAACTASVLRTHLGTANREFHQWYKLAADDYKGVLKDERFRQASGVYLQLTDEQLAAVSDMQAGDERSALNVKKLALLGLSARIQSLWMFPKRAQSELLRLLADVSIYNEEAEKADHYLKLTFQKLEGANHEIAQGNLLGSYRSLAKVAQQLADQSARCEAGLRSGNWPA